MAVTAERVGRPETLSVVALAALAVPPPVPPPSPSPPCPCCDECEIDESSLTCADRGKTH